LSLIDRRRGSSKLRSADVRRTKVTGGTINKLVTRSLGPEPIARRLVQQVAERGGAV
jgi:hypothetical protein